MSLKLTLAALALGLAAATDCCAYNTEGVTPLGCNCDTEPDPGCFKTGEEPFTRPDGSPPQCPNGEEVKPGVPCEGGFRPKVVKAFCDPEDYFNPGGLQCPKDTEENNPDNLLPNGETSFCCGGKYFDCGEESLEDCFKKCAFNWCDGKGDASGFDRVKEDPDSDKTICVPITEPPTPEPQNECPAGFECTLGVDSSCDEKPGDLKCCPLPTSRRRRLNFYQSTGCCQEACE